MKIFTDTAGFQEYCKTLKKKGTLGFVPTMGCLHEGHLSLIKKSVENCRYTVVSIFVNPLQFGPKEDLKVYPRPRENDLKLCKQSSVEAVFLPDEQKFYEKDFSIKIEESKLSRNFCGFFRPGHFSGVLTVVAKLLNAANPDYLYMGQKDYQQCMVIKRMIRDLSFPGRLVICPTIREKSGLALSSRNTYLIPDDKTASSQIYENLKKIKSLYLRNQKSRKESFIQELKETLTKGLNAIHGFSIQYAELADADTLEPVTKDSRKVVILVAGFMGKTRLIDNILL